MAVCAAPRKSFRWPGGSHEPLMDTGRGSVGEEGGGEVGALAFAGQGKVEAQGKAEMQTENCEEHHSGVTRCEVPRRVVEGAAESAACKSGGGSMRGAGLGRARRKQRARRDLQEEEAEAEQGGGCGREEELGFSSGGIEGRKRGGRDGEDGWSGGSRIGVEPMEENIWQEEMAGREMGDEESVKPKVGSAGQAELGGGSEGRSKWRWKSESDWMTNHAGTSACQLDAGTQWFWRVGGGGRGGVESRGE
ncbi:unnamed protein product [Closterium sp. NIES-64]|nr:unnamed protein product [Closterium sp. NIES-64]